MQIFIEKFKESVEIIKNDFNKTFELLKIKHNNNYGINHHFEAIKTSKIIADYDYFEAMYMYVNSPSKFLYLLKLSILVESYLEKYNQKPYIKTIVEQTKYNLTNINDVVVYLNTISEIKNDEALVFDYYVKLLAYFVCKFTFDENGIKEILKNFHTKAIDMNYNPRINNADVTANLTYNKIYDLASVNHNFLQKCDKIDKKIITAYKPILET